jgi:hypothetical protein
MFASSTFTNPLAIYRGSTAKLDCARFMLQEAIKPTLHRTAVVIGAHPDVDEK